MQITALPRHSMFWQEWKHCGIRPLKAAVEKNLQARPLSLPPYSAWLYRELFHVFPPVQSTHPGWLLQKPSIHGHPTAFVPFCSWVATGTGGGRPIAISASGWSSTLTHSLSKEASCRRTTQTQNVHWIPDSIKRCTAGYCQLTFTKSWGKAPPHHQRDLSQPCNINILQAEGKPWGCASTTAIGLQQQLQPA